MPTTYYELLDVAPDASTEEIRTAYRSKVKETHPDVSDEPDAADQFQRVQRAKDVLTDDTKRDRYDRLGHEAYVDGVVNPATDTASDTENSAADGNASASTTETAEASGRTSTAAGETTTATDDTSARDGGASAKSARSRASEGATRSQRRTASRSGGGNASSGGTASGGGTAYATRTSTSHRSYDGLRVPLTPRTAVTMITTFALYPVFVFSSIFPDFPLTVNVVLALCTLFVIAYLISMPEIAIVVFGAWSVLAPLLLLSVQWLSLFSLVGMVALVASWFPLGLALLARSALRM